MTLLETVDLLRVVRALCPHQKLDEYTSEAWHQVLSELRIEDCLNAVGVLGMRGPFVSPAEIRQEVRRVRDDRLARFPLPAPPADLTPVETIAWQREMTRRIADGDYQPLPPQLTRPMPPLDGVFPRVP